MKIDPLAEVAAFAVGAALTAMMIELIYSVGCLAGWWQVGTMIVR